MKRPHPDVEAAVAPQRAPDTTLLNICEALHAEGASEPASIVHEGSSHGFPFVTGLNVEGIGLLPTPFRQCSPLLRGQVCAPSQAGVQPQTCSQVCIPSHQFAFDNPAWQAHIQQLAQGVRKGFKLPKVCMCQFALHASTCICKAMCGNVMEWSACIIATCHS